MSWITGLIGGLSIFTGVWCGHRRWYTQLFGAHVLADVAADNLVYLDDYRTRYRTQP